MLHRYVTLHSIVAVGDSGRIVLEIDPAQKQSLYAALGRDGITLKDWFLRQVGGYLRHADQLSFFAPASVAETPKSPPVPEQPKRVRYSVKRQTPKQQHK
jgi:hypothetical protein